MVRAIIDARGPSGEVVPLRVYEGTGHEAKLICAKVPCMVDFKRLGSRELTISNFFKSADADSIQPKLKAEVPFFTHGTVTVLLVNVAEMSFGAGGPVGGKSAFLQFDATPEEAARFLEAPSAR